MFRIVVTVERERSPGCFSRLEKLHKLLSLKKIWEKTAHVKVVSDH